MTRTFASRRAEGSSLSTALVALSLTTLAACGSAPASTSSQGEGNTGTHSGSGGAGGAGQGQGGELELLGGMGGQGGSDFIACATSSEEATLIPVTMFITVDRSGSMGNDNKWNNAKSAFFAFFQDPEAASLNVALRFWPEGSCNGDQCDVAECATPHVGLGSLGDAGARVVARRRVREPQPERQHAHGRGARRRGRRGRKSTSSRSRTASAP
jgi:hypothetical protein